jgi:hypothetical protein
MVCYPLQVGVAYSMMGLSVYMMFRYSQRLRATEVQAACLLAEVKRLQVRACVCVCVCVREGYALMREWPHRRGGAWIKSTLLKSAHRKEVEQ